MLDILFAVQTMPMADADSKEKAARDIQLKIANLEYKFYGDINVTN